MKNTFDEMCRILLPQVGRQFVYHEPTKQELIDFSSPILASYEWTIEEFMDALKEHTKSTMREDRNRRKKLRKTEPVSRATAKFAINQVKNGLI